MQEDFLHYVWKYLKFDVLRATTVQHEALDVVLVGQHNTNSGPDFFNAQIKIGKQLWAGNVEIHVKSSDWFVHNHEQDKAYDNVILHVVWEHDTEIFRKDNTVIPTLELESLVHKSVLSNYQKLFRESNKWINCESDFPQVDSFVIDHWLERLYFERLERKSETILKLLKASNNDWELVLFQLLAKNFGLKVNGDAFFSLAQSFPFSIVRKVQSNINHLEALFFGQSGLLDDEVQAPYFLRLTKEYQFLKQKFQLDNSHVVPVKFFRLRPPNFPTIRLSQLASLYHLHHNLFSKLIEIEDLEGYYSLFKVSTTKFWESHYSFNSASKTSKKVLTKPFIDLLLINTIIPIKFSYAKSLGKDIDEIIVNLVQGLSSEKNSIVEKFDSLKPISKSALESQALLQLKSEYCDKNKCLQCVIGNTLLLRN
ncbi:uncharacterized protein DUF2851 [Flavobacteriaceae bacterium MAR_2010_105]|nr:uncharacterized protein DUF2851 [Flavobacteriaceae bacterium MAR_2010_105]